MDAKTIKEFEKIISSAVDRLLEEKVKNKIQIEVQKAYTQRVKIDFDGDMAELRNEIGEVKNTVDEIKEILIGNKEYGIDGLAPQVKRNTKIIDRALWLWSGLVIIGGIIGGIIQEYIKKLIEKG